MPIPHGDDDVLRLALDAASMVMWEWDVRSGIIRYSDNVTDVAAGEDVERYCTIDSLRETIHPDDRDRMTQAVERTLREQAPYECEYRVRMLDGQYRWILGKGKSVIVRGGRVLRILGISQDITARKQAEEELQRRSRQLAELASQLILVEHRERRRLADLVHDQLQQILVGARLQIHSLATVNHGTHAAEFERLRRAMDEALGVAGAITRDLAPPVSMHRDNADAFCWLARDLKERHGLAVDVRIKYDLSAAREAETVLLFTAARELLLNVVKHSGVRKASLRLFERDSRIVLQVSDRGHGIQSSASSDAPGSSGFGLFSIRERAELLGGTLTVETSREQGTTVTLEMPAPVARMTPVPRRRRTGVRGAVSKSAPPPSGPGPDVRGARALRVVIADDHRTVREGIASWLKDESCCDVVGEADTGEQAVKLAQELQPDVVVMDVSMPVMDGIEATRIITRKWPGIRVVGLSMHSDESVVRRMLSAGASDYVTKSAPPERLIEALRACTGARTAPDPAD